jgi:N-acetylglucosaminyldiphosphoundecaprenol N-acetyl-beta-D-mannosaminyltransferase
MSIPEVTNYTLEYANKNRLKVLLFGAKQEVNSKAIENLSLKYPRIQFTEGINGYFKETDEKNIVERINLLSPDIVLIGISTPIKERFAFNHKNDLKSSIIIPCGGMIDVYAGLVKQSPYLVKKMGFATAYRIMQEPRRLFRLHTWLVYETIFKILPITIYYRLLKRQKEFNLIDKYLRFKIK